MKSMQMGFEGVKVINEGYFNFFYAFVCVLYHLHIKVAHRKFNA